MYRLIYALTENTNCSHHYYQHHHHQQQHHSPLFISRTAATLFRLTALLVHCCFPRRLEENKKSSPFKLYCVAEFYRELISKYKRWTGLLNLLMKYYRWGRSEYLFFLRVCLRWHCLNKKILFVTPSPQRSYDGKRKQLDIETKLSRTLPTSKVSKIPTLCVPYNKKQLCERTRQCHSTDVHFAISGIVYLIG